MAKFFMYGKYSQEALKGISADRTKTAITIKLNVFKNLFMNSPPSLVELASFNKRGDVNSRASACSPRPGAIDMPPH